MKKWITLLVLVLAVLIGGAIYAVEDIVAAQYSGSEAAAQAVLDNTVMDHIDNAYPYTGGMQGYYFRGTDKLGRTVYVWTQDNKPIALEYASNGLSESQAIAAAQKPVWANTLVRDTMKNQPLLPVVQVVHAMPGPVLRGANTEYQTAPSGFVWEIYGKLSNGKYAYTYEDFKSGQVLWQYALSQAQ